jgi:hypothetical protein
LVSDSGIGELVNLVKPLSLSCVHFF